MKEDLVEYICALSGNDYDLLEEIMIKKYKKFINFFELVRDYGDDIVKLKYNDTHDDNILDITITMRGNIKNDIKKELRDSLMKLGYVIDSKIVKRKITVQIKYDEHRK